MSLLTREHFCAHVVLCTCLSPCTIWSLLPSLLAGCGSAPQDPLPHVSLPMSAIPLPALSEPSQPAGQASSARAQRLRSIITRTVTVDAIRADRWRYPPEVCPEGPWKDLAAAIQQISQFTVDCKSGDGGFGERKCSGLTQATSMQGRRQLHKQSNKISERESTCIGTGCPFVLWVEESTEGWVIKDWPGLP